MMTIVEHMGIDVQRMNNADRMETLLSVEIKKVFLTTILVELRFNLNHNLPRMAAGHSGRSHAYRA